MIPFCKPWFQYDPDYGTMEARAAAEVINSGWLAAGEKTKQFEEEFAKYVGVKYAIFTNSCTSALKMAYKYIKENNPHTLVYYPKNTFSATYSAASEMGLEVSSYEKKDWQEDGEIWVNVHYGGVKDETTPCYLEDSAHRIEKDDPLIGAIRCYSFYVTKNLTTGAGGMFVTDDESIYKKARLWWSDGIDKSTFDRQHGGWNYKVMADAGGYDGNDLAAAIGLIQLKFHDTRTLARNHCRDRYNEAFGKSWEGNHLYPYFVDKLEDVGRLMEHLKKDGIQASYHYPGTGWLGVSLPIYPMLSVIDQNKIINSVRRFK